MNLIMHVNCMLAVPKPGQCPAPVLTEFSVCEVECDYDHDCAGEAKCCDTGCGKLCTLPGEAGAFRMCDDVTSCCVRSCGLVIFECSVSLSGCQIILLN